MAGNDLGEAFGCLAKIILLLTVLTVFGMGYFFYNIYFKQKKDKELVSPTILISEKQLIIKNNKVDTLYVYKLKKE